MKQVKIFSRSKLRDMEDAINSFAVELQKAGSEIIDIKFNSVFNSEYNLFQAMIIYQLGVYET